MKKLLWLLLFAVPAMGQVSNPSIIQPGTSPAGGACSAQLPLQVFAGVLYSCQSGVLTSVSGSGVFSAGGDLSGTSSSQTVIGINGVKLSTLATCVLKNTTTTGAPSCAVGSDLPTAIPIASVGSAGLSGTAPVAISTAGAISMHVADTSDNGYLSSTDWNTFNGKQAALSLLAGTYVNGDWCSYASSGTLLNCNNAAPQAALTLVKGTYVDGDLCSYTAAGTLLNCNTTAGGTGTVTVVASGLLNSTALVTGGGGTTLQTPSATATMDSSGNISTPGTISTGTGATKVTGGTAGAISPAEGTVPTGVSGSSTIDPIYADSTLQADKECPNSTSSGLGTCYPMALMPSGNTSPILSATSPITISSGSAVACATCGVTGSPLSQFASTSSSQLAGVLSDEVGTGKVVFYGAINGAGAGLTTGPATSVSGDCVEFTGTAGQIADNGSTCGGGGGASALSAITAATGANTIASGNNSGQIWNWALSANTEVAITFGETTASTLGTLGNQYIGKFLTLAGSTAVPINVSNSLTGSQILPALHVTPTWNTTGVVDAAVLINATNTASGSGSKLLDAQLGGTSEASIDKAGNVNAQSSVSVGTAPTCTAGTSGGLCLTEGTNITNTTGNTAVDANSTTHEIAVATNGSTSFGLLARVQPVPIHSPGLTGSVGTATLCAASAGACNVAGQYEINVDFAQGGTACASVVAGSVTFNLTWTDANGNAHSAVSLPIDNQTTDTTLSAGFNFTTSNATAAGTGSWIIWTNGSVIQYSTTYVACTTGTGTYQVDASVTRLQ